MMSGLDTSVQGAVLQVRATVGVARLSDYALLEITGADSAVFLQNRLSNDVLALQPGQGQLNAVLDRQGKVEGVFSLYRTANDFFAIVERAALESTIQGILKYRIVERVEIAEGLRLPEMPDAATGFHAEAEANAEASHYAATIFSIQGPMAKSILSNASTPPDRVQSLAESLATMPEHAFLDACLFGITTRIIQRSLSGENGYLLLADASHAESLHDALKSEVLSRGGAEMSEAVREILRVEAGLPLFGRDYDRDTLLPETGLEREAVSYSKGCYLGQETIARIKTYGTVQQALVGLVFEEGAEMPPAGSECLLEGEKVGTIQSGVDSPTLKRPIAMAYLGKNERVPGKKLNLEIAGRICPATVALLPFYDARKQRLTGTELLAEGLKLFSEGYDEEATRILKQAIEADPALVDAYEALGVILSRQEKHDEAIALMEKVLELDPDHVLAHTNLSVFYMKKGDKEKAEEEKAKATMAAFSRKMRESGQVYDIEAERRKKEQAALEKIGMFQEALKFNPNDPLGNFGLGSAYLELRRYAEAVAPLERVLKAQPKHSVAWLTLGKALEGAGDKDRVREAYQKGIEVAAAKGDLMPLREMQSRLAQLDG